MKKIILSLSVIVAVAAIVIGGTIAYFSDTEVSEGNTFTAGNLDVTIAEGESEDFSVSFTNMAPGEWTEKQKLNLINSGSLAQVIDRIQVSGLEENDRTYTLEDSQNMEQRWIGSDPTLFELSDPLEVKVNYDGSDRAVFHAWAPDDYGWPGDDMMTFAFDVDNNGEADFQIQWNTNGEQKWNYDEPIVGTWNWEKDWVEVPGDFVTGKDGKHFWVKIPVSYLGGYDSEYKFGVDSNGHGSGKGQTFYSTDPWNLWSTQSQPGNYTTSENYVPMSTKSAKDMNANQVAKNINVKVYHNGLIRQGTLWNFYKSGDNKNMILNGNEITLNPGEEGWYNFEFQLDPSVGNDYQGDGIEATFEVEAVQEGQE
ncbi:MAG: hypothetical protein AVO34_01815 [Firmicutes bacterium ML8_F2]|jgi:predicted ribosomally synthesized peptide with SipW-like signal peptide|nr:MAG: hypothetical protein AVO34_01815 [Firmicutes bacterium ML8_F2]